MDLKSIKNIVEHAPIDSARPSHATGGVRNLVAFRRLVKSVEEVEPLKKAVTKIKESAVFSTIQDDLAMTGPDAAALYRQADDFYQAVVALRTVVRSLAPDAPPESITVRLPGVNELSAVVELLSDLNKALSQLVLNEEIAGDVKVESWETGSLLILLYLKSLAAVDLVGRALKSAVVVYQEVQRGRLMGQQVKNYKIKNETLEDLQQAQSELLKELVSREAKAIDAAAFKKKDAERLERIKNSVKLLAALIERGTVIYPSLTMPPAQQEVFPDFKQLGTVATAIRQIEDASAPKAEPTGGETANGHVATESI